jgi:hypothetical protein
MSTTDEDYNPDEFDDSDTETETYNSKHSRRMQKKRKCMTEDDILEMNYANSRRMKMKRKVLTQDEILEINEANSRRMQEKRKSMTEEEILEMNEANSSRMQQKRKSMTEEEILQMNEANAERMRNFRQQQTESKIPTDLFNLSVEEEDRIYEEVAKALNDLREYVCAVCDKRIYENERTLNPLSTISQQLLESMRNKLVFPLDLDSDLCDFYDMSSYSHMLQGIMLSKGGIVLDDLGEVILSICTSCKRSLTTNSSSKTPPKYAIANGLFIGMLPLEFKDTTRTEHALLNRAQSSAFVMTAIGGYNRKMSSHAYSFSC